MSDVLPVPSAPAVKCLSLDVVAVRWRVSVASLRAWVATGRLHAVMVKGRLVLPAAEVERVGRGVPCGFIDP